MTSAATTSAHPSGVSSILQRLEIRLLLTLLAVSATLTGFIYLTSEVREGETSRFDRSVILAFRVAGDLGTPIGPRWLQESARDVTALGGVTVLTLLTVGGVAMLLMHGRRYQAIVFGGTVILAQATAEILKHFVGRERPMIVPQHDLVYSSSFPSGHAMMAPVAYLTLAAILSAGDRRRSVKVLMLATAALLMIAVGVSRVYLGVHWPTDVLGGWTLGLAIASASAFVLHATAPVRGLAAEVKPDRPGAP
jgi:undecaprenyl-diphosphatase